LRIVGRGLRDTYDNLFGFTLASLGWWMASLPVLVLWPFISWLAVLGFLPFGPAATLTLMTVVDPRRVINRPDPREAFDLFLAKIVFGWKLAAATMIVPVVLLNNILVFGGSDTWLAGLSPLWTVLFVIAVVYCVVAYSVAAMADGSLSETLRRTAFVLVAAPFRSLFVVAMLVLLVVVGTLLVVPLILFVPAIVATTLDRHVSRAFDLEIVDPNTPTPERLQERAKGTEPSQAGRLFSRRR
jgi:hypothetical protein